MPFASFRLPFLASLAVLLAACGGNVETTRTGGGAGGGDAGVSAFCTTYCASLLALAVPPACTLPDPAAASSTCLEACQSGWLTCSPSEQSIAACCSGAPHTGTCPTTPPCYTQAAQLTTGKCLGAVHEAASDPTEQCSNGMTAFGSECGAEQDGTGPCVFSCNTPNGTLTISATCTPTTPAATAYACTCTAGKATGKPFTYEVPAGSMGSSAFCPGPANGVLWNECNL